MPVDKHVHGQHTNHLGDDEGQGPEVEGPAVRVTILFGVALGGVSSIGRYVHYDANDVTQTCGAQDGHGGGRGRIREKDVNFQSECQTLGGIQGWDSWVSCCFHSAWIGERIGMLASITSVLYHCIWREPQREELMATDTEEGREE